VKREFKLLDVLFDQRMSSQINFSSLLFNSIKTKQDHASTNGELSYEFKCHCQKKQNRILDAAPLESCKFVKNTRL